MSPAEHETAIRRAVERKQRAEREYRQALRSARQRGLSFDRIGRAAGMSRQAARKHACDVEPRKVEHDLRARLATLNERWTVLIGQVAPKFDLADPAGEQLHRNGVNGSIRRSVAGVNRAGHRAGYAGKHRGRREMVTVADEARGLAEAKLLDLLNAHASEPWAVTAQGELEEAFSIRQRLEALQDARL